MMTDDFDFPAEFETEPDDVSDTLLFDESLPPDHRSGFVAVIGRPNVGKSTLMNHYLGQKIAIVSPKPQTTRNQLLGILTLPNPAYPDFPAAQLIFVDTPGIHQPHHKLGEYLLATARNALPEADVIVWLVDVTRAPGEEEQLVAESIRAAQAEAGRSGQPQPPVILALNKTDLLAGDVDAVAQTFLTLYPATAWLPLSAAQGDNCPALLRQIIGHLPPGPRYFPAEQVTDQQERFIAAELIREAALNILRQEIPHALAVVVTEFKQRHEKLTYISANLILERKSHKPIVIGEKGRTLKKIGQTARPQLETLVGNKVYLELWVKIRPKWRREENELKWLGYG